MLSCQDDPGLDFHRSSPVGVLACCDPAGNPPCTCADRVPLSGKRWCTAATIVLTLRAYFNKEAAACKSFNLFRPAQCTAEATGLSPAFISRLANEEYVATRPEDGTLETRRSSRRVPQEELARVSKAIYAQYHIPMLPTLDSTLAYLNAPPEETEGAGASAGASASTGAGAGAIAVGGSGSFAGVAEGAGAGAGTTRGAGTGEGASGRAVASAGVGGRPRAGTGAAAAAGGGSQPGAYPPRRSQRRPDGHAASPLREG